MPYRVRVAEMWHYMDQDEEYDLEPFDTFEAAEQTAREMVKGSLRYLRSSGESRLICFSARKCQRRLADW